MSFGWIHSFWDAHETLIYIRKLGHQAQEGNMDLEIIAILGATKAKDLNETSQENT